MNLHIILDVPLIFLITQKSVKNLFQRLFVANEKERRKKALTALLSKGYEAD